MYLTKGLGGCAIISDHQPTHNPTHRLPPAALGLMHSCHCKSLNSPNGRLSTAARLKSISITQGKSSKHRRPHCTWIISTLQLI